MTPPIRTPQERCSFLAETDRRAAELVRRLERLERSERDDPRWARAADLARRVRVAVAVRQEPSK